MDMQINGFSKYLVDENGAVKSFVKKWKNTYRTLRPKVSKSGHGHYHLLGDDGKRTSILIHRLVAIIFIPNPKNYSIVNHLDGNPMNNNIKNLEWCDQSRNMMHSYYELKKQGYKNRPIVQMSMDGEVIKVWPSVNRASKELGFKSTSAIWHALQRRSSYCRGFKWVYQ